MRLDKFLAHAEWGTRKRVQQIVRSGRVTINGKIVKDPGVHVGNNDEIACEGKPVKLRGPQVIAFHKPAGLVTSTADPQATIYAVFPFDPNKIKPIGRLDKETEGLILMTDDGDLNHGLCSPRHHVEKEYEVELDRGITDQLLRDLKLPMTVEHGLKFRGAISAVKVSEKTLRLVIDEGKYHQVRRMCRKLGYHVDRLRRVRIGPIHLEPLKQGEHRVLGEEELQNLRIASGLLKAQRGIKSSGQT